jgi:hypothetical protein
MNPRLTVSLLAVAATSTAALPAAAQARSSTYKIVSATHSSSSSKTDEHYSGSSTTTWKLPKPAKLTVNFLFGKPVAQAWLHVRGTFTGRASTDWPGNCSLTAPTGSSEYPAVAPGLVPLTIGPDPKGTGKTFATFMGQQATLGNPYFGTECSTSLTGEPDADRTSLKPVSPKLFKRTKITLKYQGSTNEDGIAYTWSTVFKLKRVKGRG